MATKKFVVVRVSDTAKDHVDDLQAALARLLAAPRENQQRVDEAYAALNQRRRELYEYIQSLEFNAGIRRQNTLRFD